MTDVFPWIGFESKEDRERFKQRIFSEYKKMKPLVTSGKDGSDRRLSDKEMRHIFNIHNARYGEGETFYMISDLIKMPKGLYWVVFCGWWNILETLEEILKKEYKNYVYLVAN